MINEMFDVRLTDLDQEDNCLRKNKLIYFEG